MPDALLVAGAGYTLTAVPGRPYVRLGDGDGGHWAELSLIAAADAVGAHDVTTWIAGARREEGDGCVRVVVDQGSTAWVRKRTIFEAHQDRIEVWLELEGRGRLVETELLGGRWYGDDRLPATRYPSSAGFQSIFNPEPSRYDRRTVRFDASAVIDVQGGATPGTEHWFFTPAPFCYAMSLEPPPVDEQALPSGPWMTAAIAAPSGANLFTAYRYRALENSWSLVLDHDGQLAVDGAWASPRVILRLGLPDPYAGLARYAADLEERGWVPDARSEPQPRWWSRPIFCGWGAQVALAAQQDESAPALATQDNYDRFLDALEANGITPGTVVVDDRWQDAYGTNAPDVSRWPDLKGWIAGRHRRGQRVLLWWKAWDPEGLPKAACVTDPGGRALATDPESPAYVERLRYAVGHMLGSDGLDADGFKVDFTGRTPCGPGLVHAGDRWGVELLHELLRLLYTEAKRVKPDALVITHAVNPYFRDVTDVVRLNDVAVERPVVAQMRHRASVATAVMPAHLIDTDNWPMPDRAQWREYVDEQPSLGVPSLYFATHLSFSGEELTPEDFALVRDAWSRSRSAVAR